MAKSNDAGGFILVLVFGAYGLWGVQSWVWGEREGIVKTDDCRTRIAVKPDSSDTWFKKFTCATLKSNKGVLIRQACEAVETSGSACEIVYSYEKKGPSVCSDPRFPYLHIDDQCYTYPE